MEEDKKKVYAADILKGLRSKLILSASPVLVPIKPIKEITNQNNQMNSESERQAEELFENVHGDLSENGEPEIHEDENYSEEESIEKSKNGMNQETPERRQPKSVTFASGQKLVTQLIVDRKWKDPVVDEKKGKFSQKEEVILNDALAFDDFRKSISSGEMERQTLRKQKFYALLATVLPNRSPLSCYKYIQRNYNDFNRRGKWSQEDTEQLLNLVSKYGRKWTIIGRQMHRSSDNVYDKYRSIGEERNQERAKSLWKIRQLVDFLLIVEKQTKVDFLDNNIKRQLDREQLHDLREKDQFLNRKYNSKNFIFHNIQVIRKYVNGKLLQTISTDSLKWSKISNKMTTRTVLDCRNKFIQLLQIFARNNSRQFDKQVVSFVVEQRVSQESKINWKLWKNEQYTIEQARNRFMILKKLIEGRSRKDFRQLLRELNRRVSKIIDVR